MAANVSLADQLLAFLQAVKVHWFALAIAGVLLVEAVFSPFRRDPPPEGRRVGLLVMAGVALFIACFQAFGDARREYLANQQPVQAAETERDTARSERDRIRGERDSLATQVAALQKQLDESRAIFTAAQQENGSPQHPFTDKARCPPGLAVIENSQAIGSSEAAAQTKRREPVCVVETRATEASLAKSK